MKNILIFNLAIQSSLVSAFQNSLSEPILHIFAIMSLFP